MNLEELKSAVRIEDQGEIHKALSVRKHGSPQTSIGRTADGKTTVAKVAMDAAPVLATAPAADLKSAVEARGMPWSDAYEGRAVDYWASDERVDAHGDIMLQNFVFTEFDGNSPMPFSHGWDGLPVGRVLQWEVRQRSAPDYQGEALWLRTLYATAEQYDFADRVFRLVKGGIFPAGSVGVWPERLIRVEDAKERAKLGMPDYGFILDAPHLLEFSPTLLGANAGALAIYSQAKSRGLLEVEDFRVIRELQRQRIERAAGDVATWREIERSTRGLQKLLFPQSTFTKHEALDEPFALIGEDEALRYAPPAESRAVEERLDRIEAMLDERLLSLASMVEDVRETVEALKERPSPGAKPERNEKERGSPTAALATRLLAAVGSINT